MNFTARSSGIAAIRAAAGLLALLAAAPFLSGLLHRTGGIPAPPLDDTWIYLQYARQAAEGEPFRYGPGAGFSTGASSLLHLALLVPGWWVGFHGASFGGFAIALGVAELAAALFLAGWCVARFTMMAGADAGADAAADGRAGDGLTLPGPATLAGLAAALLLAARGHVVWAALSGMDTILLAAALGAVAARVAVAGPGPGLAWWMAGGLGFVRPEGIPLGFTALAVLWFESWRRRAGAGGPGARAAGSAVRGLTWLGAMALLLSPALLNVLLVGSPQWDSMRVKGLWSETRPDVLATLLRELPSVWGEIALLPIDDFHRFRLSTVPGAAFAALVLAGFLPGWWMALTGRLGAAGRILALWIPLQVLLGGMSPGWHSHYHRYQIPLLWPVTVLMVTGWWRLAGPARAGGAPSRARALLPLAATAAVLLLLAGGYRQMAGLYARNGANILEQQVRVGRWIHDNTPPDTRVAVNDAGAIAYFGGRPIVDLVGLVSHGWSPASRQGSGALFERLESLPAAERPDLFAWYPRWFPQLAATNFGGPVLFKVDLVDNTICGDRLKQVQRIDWSLAGSGDRPVQRLELIRDFGMTLVDSVDVADQASEAAHAYRWYDTFRDRLREFPTAGPDGGVAMDGGRWIADGESMRVRARPGQWLVLVMRTEGEKADTLDVSVNGRPAGVLGLPRLAAAWSEPLLQIPDSLVVDSLLTVEVRWRRSATGDGYGSYHYWFLQ
jgi:hypothetical protein